MQWEGDRVAVAWKHEEENGSLLGGQGDVNVGYSVSFERQSSMRTHSQMSILDGGPLLHYCISAF